jgi:MFS family permease
MMTLIGMFTYEFTVSLPLLAQGSASVYAAMTAAMGLGAVAGGLYTAGRARGEPRELVWQAGLFGVAVLLTALAPTVPLALLALLGVGFFSIRFTALGNSTLQLESLPEMRGRVMSLWTMTFLGTTPIGGPIIGWIGEHWQAHLALVVGALACFAAAAYGAWDLGRQTASTDGQAERGDRGA